MKRQKIPPMVLLGFGIVFLSAMLLWWLDPVRSFSGPQVLAISLRSPLFADYSADLRSILRLPPLALRIIEDSIRDRQITQDSQEILRQLLTPVPTVTPGLGTPGGVPPTLVIFTRTATASVPTQPGGTAVFTPTATQSPTSTVSLANTVVVLPSRTQPGPTATNRPPIETAVPPTSVPPTAVPPTAVPPTPVPPTAVPPTAYIPPPTDVPSYP